MSAVLNADRILILDAWGSLPRAPTASCWRPSPVYRDIYDSQMESEGEFDGAA